MSGGSLNMIWNSTFSVFSKFLWTVTWGSWWVSTLAYPNLLGTERLCCCIIVIHTYIPDIYLFCYVNRSLIMRTEVAKMSRLVDFYYSCLLLIEHINSILAFFIPANCRFLWNYHSWKLSKVAEKPLHTKLILFVELAVCDVACIFNYLFCWHSYPFVLRCMSWASNLFICCRWKWCSPWNCA